MKAGNTKIVLAIWLTGWLSAMFYQSGWVAATGFLGSLGITVMLAYWAGRGDDAWM